MGPGTTVTTPSSGVNQKLQSIRNWTISTYKCSIQTLYERLGKTNKTVNLELEGQIEKLRDTREKYENILRLSRALTSHFYHVVTTQSSLGQDNDNDSHSNNDNHSVQVIASPTWPTSLRSCRRNSSVMRRLRKI